MTALVVFLGCACLLLAILLAVSSGDVKHAERRLARVRAERDLLRTRITDAAAAAAPRPPLPRRPKPPGPPPADQPLTDHEARQWADILNHLEQP